MRERSSLERRSPSEVALRPVAAPAVAVAGPVGDMAWERLLAQAHTLVASGFLPAAVNTPEKAVAIALTGQELGIPTMLALRSIHIINGKPTLSADLMASLVLREIDRHRDGELVALPPTAEGATVRYRRWGQGETLAFTFTLEDAKRANLLGKDTWKAYPGAMLRARAIANVCRMAFPDVCAGLYTPEELVPDEGSSFMDRHPAWPAADDDEALDRAWGAEEPDPEHDPDMVFIPLEDGAVVDGETGEIVAEAGDPDRDLLLMTREQLKADIEANRAPPLAMRWGDIMLHAAERDLQIDRNDDLVALARDVRQMRRELTAAGPEMDA